MNKRKYYYTEFRVIYFNPDPNKDIDRNNDGVDLNNVDKYLTYEDNKD